MAEEQGSILDFVIEDEELEQALRKIADNEEAHNAYREAIKAARGIMEVRHPEAINRPEGDLESGFIRCGIFRFVASTTHRDAESKTVTMNVSAGDTWAPFEIQKVDLFSAGK